MTISRLLFLSIFVLSISAFSYGQNTQDKKGTNPNKHTEQTKKVKTPIAIETITPVPENKSQSNEQARIYAPWTWSVDNWLNFILVCITGLLAWFTFGLFRATKELADSALKQGNDFKEHSKRELRAYVFVDVNGDRSANLGENGNTVSLKFLPFFKNTGKTPAHRMKYYVFAKPQNLENPIDFTAPQIEEYSFVSLGPGQEIQGSYGPIIYTTEAFNNLLASKTEKIHVFGTITYDDIFGHEWKTDFSYLVIMSNNFITEIGARKFHCTWKNTKDHNDAT